MLRRWDRQQNILGFFFQPFTQPGSPEGDQDAQPSTLATNETSNHSYTARLNNINFRPENIPKEFIDYIFECDILENPVRLDGHHVMDFNNLKKWWATSGRDKINPITNNPYISLEMLDGLKEKIEAFVSEQEVASEKMLREIQEKIRLHQQRREEMENERLKNIEEHNARRKILTETIERLIEISDETVLKPLFLQLDKVDRKIKKLRLGNAYDNDLQHLNQRIQHSLKKREQFGENERGELKLNRLLHQFETLVKKKPIILSRTRFRHSIFNTMNSSVPGLLGFINQSEVAHDPNRPEF